MGNVGFCITFVIPLHCELKLIGLPAMLLEKGQLTRKSYTGIHIQLQNGWLSKDCVKCQYKTHIHLHRSLQYMSFESLIRNMKYFLFDRKHHLKIWKS